MKGSTAIAVGVCVFSLRCGDRTSPEYGQVCQGLADAGIWDLALETGPFQVMPVGEPDGYHEVRAYRVR